MKRIFLTSETRLLSQKGLSIVELLISMVIGLAVIAGSVQVVMNSKREFIDQNEIQFIQTNARYAIEVMKKDLLMAGYLGCAVGDEIDVANTLNNDAGGFASLSGLVGYEGDGANALDVYPDAYKDEAIAETDTVLIRYANPNEKMEVQSHNPYIAQLTMWDTPTYGSGSTMVIAESNCRAVGIFQVSAVSGSTISHGMGSSGGTYNCTNVLRGDINCSMSSCGENSCGGYTNISRGYTAGSQIMPFVSHAYYVGPSSVVPGMNALKREVFNSSGIPATAPEEIALGVDDFEIVYGVDSNENGNIDSYVSANSVSDWNRVVNVKLTLVLRSRSPVHLEDHSNTLSGVTYTDRFLRSMVNSTIKIRNRG